MGVGFEAAGAQTIAYVEQNPAFCDWLRSHTDKEVIQAEVGSQQAVVRSHAASGGSPVIAAGVSCQPFSRMGDMKQELDERSTSFGDTLLMAFKVRSPLVILECTQEVMTSQWAQQTLRSFAHQTGYRLHQQVLRLDTVWPGRRTRWWATLTHPLLGMQEIPELPSLSFQPGLLHVLPSVPTFPTGEIQQLLLDTYELCVFNS